MFDTLMVFLKIFFKKVDIEKNSRIQNMQNYLFPACSDFIWDFGKLPFPTHLGKYFIKSGKIRAKIHEIGKIKAIFGLGMTPIYGLKMAK